MTTLQLQQLIPPGKSILIHDLSWQEFENILEELGEHRSARVAQGYFILNSFFNNFSP